MGAEAKHGASNSFLAGLSNTVDLNLSLGRGDMLLENGFK